MEVRSLLRRDQVLTWPNLFTLLRLFCIPLFVWLLFSKQDRVGAASLLAVLGSTDWVDGWIARRYNQTSEFGAIFDPTVDRLLFFVAVPSLVVDGSLLFALAVLVFAREAIVAGLAIVYTKQTGDRFEVTFEGKTGTFLLMFAFPLFLAAASSLSVAAAMEWLAWFCITPGLAYSWYSALGQYGRDVYRVSNMT